MRKLFLLLACIEFTVEKKWKSKQLNTPSGYVKKAIRQYLRSNLTNVYFNCKYKSAASRILKSHGSEFLKNASKILVKKKKSGETKICEFLFDAWKKEDNSSISAMRLFNLSERYNCEIPQKYLRKLTKRIINSFSGEMDYLNGKIRYLRKFKHAKTFLYSEITLFNINNDSFEAHIQINNRDVDIENDEYTQPPQLMMERTCFGMTQSLKSSIDIAIYHTFLLMVKKNCNFDDDSKNSLRALFPNVNETNYWDYLYLRFHMITRFKIFEEFIWERISNLPKATLVTKDLKKINKSDKIDWTSAFIKFETSQTCEYNDPAKIYTLSLFKNYDSTCEADRNRIFEVCWDRLYGKNFSSASLKCLLLLERSEGARIYFDKKFINSVTRNNDVRYLQENGEPTKAVNVTNWFNVVLSIFKWSDLNNFLNKLKGTHGKQLLIDDNILKILKIEPCCKFVMTIDDAFFYTFNKYKKFPLESCYSEGKFIRKIHLEDLDYISDRLSGHEDLIKTSEHAQKNIIKAVVELNRKKDVFFDFSNCDGSADSVEIFKKCNGSEFVLRKTNILDWLKETIVYNPETTVAILKKSYPDIMTKWKNDLQKANRLMTKLGDFYDRMQKTFNNSLDMDTFIFQKIGRDSIFNDTKCEREKHGYICKLNKSV